MVSNGYPLLQRTTRLMLQKSRLFTAHSSILRPQLQPSRHINTSTAKANKTSSTFYSAFLHNLLGRHPLTRPFARPSAFLHAVRQRRGFSSTRTNPFSFTRASRNASSTAQEPNSLSARLRKLSREYGWSAFGVYMALSALDFPFCFLAVRTLGTERIGRWEHAVVEWVKRAIPVNWPGKVNSAIGGQKDGFVEEAGEVVGEGIDKGLEKVDGAIAGWDHGVREAEMENSGDKATIWTQLALAYAIHKSFIFLRVPLTAAVTPKVVKTLRGWGWNIGKRAPKAERDARKAAKAAEKAAKGS